MYKWMQLYAPKKRPAKEKTINLCKVYHMERELETLREQVMIFRRSGCGINSSNDEKIKAVDKLQKEFTVYSICQTLGLLRSTYYHRKIRSPEKKWFNKYNDFPRPKIFECFEKSNERFGAEKITCKLCQEGIVTSRVHVSKLMKEMDLVCKQARLRYSNSTNRKYKYH